MPAESGRRDAAPIATVTVAVADPGPRRWSVADVGEHRGDPCLGVPQSPPVALPDHRERSEPLDRRRACPDLGATVGSAARTRHCAAVATASRGRSISTPPPRRAPIAPVRYSMKVRLDGNRWWYVIAHGFRSRTVHQRVAALITLAASDDARRARRSGHVHGDGLAVTRRPAGGAATARIRRVANRRAGNARPDIRASRSPMPSRVTALTSCRTYLRWGAHNINSYSPAVTVTVNGIFKIKHVVIIMQENRSFDQYFGTFPGADGIPGLAGNLGTVPCVPDTVNGGCVQTVPRHERQELRRSARRRERHRRHGLHHSATRAGCRWTASWARPRRARAVPATTRTAARARPALAPSASTRWAITTAARSPTTGPTPRTTCSRTTCTSRMRPGASPSTCSRCRSGRRSAPTR